MNVEVLPRWPPGWKPDHVRVLCATTANDGHFGPLLPFAEACVRSGHEVRVAAPLSYGPALARAGFPHEPCADAPPEAIGPIMAGLASLPFAEANDVVVREVFGRIDAQAALPRLLEIVEGWRPDVVLRESAELSSLAAAERFGVPHVQVCVGMHEVAARFAETIGQPLAELGRQAGLSPRHLASALAAEATVSLVPEPSTSRLATPRRTSTPSSAFTRLSAPCSALAQLTGEIPTNRWCTSTSVPSPAPYLPLPGSSGRRSTPSTALMRTS